VVTVVSLMASKIIYTTDIKSLFSNYLQASDGEIGEVEEALTK
jgi:hypothetical protein